MKMRKFRVGLIILAVSKIVYAPDELEIFKRNLEQKNWENLKNNIKVMIFENQDHKTRIAQLLQAKKALIISNKFDASVATIISLLFAGINFKNWWYYQPEPHDDEYVQTVNGVLTTAGCTCLCTAGYFYRKLEKEENNLNELLAILSKIPIKMKSDVELNGR